MVFQNQLEWREQHTSLAEDYSQKNPACKKKRDLYTLSNETNYIIKRDL